MGGNAITTLYLDEGTYVGELVRHMERGRIPGLNATQLDTNGMYMERFIVLCSSGRMSPVSKVTEHFRTGVKCMTLVKQFVDEDARMRMAMG